MLFRFLAASACALLSGSALADAEVSLTVANYTHTKYGGGTGRVEYQANIARGTTAASGYADLGAGLLQASASSSDETTSSALATFFDTLTFSTGASGIAYLDYHWNASLAPYYSTDPSNASLELTISPSDGSPPISYTHNVTNYKCGSDCTQGNADEGGSLAFAIKPQTTIRVSEFAVTGGSNGTSSASAAFYLRLPAGLTYTSASGQFFSTAAPVSLLPEPGIYAMLLSGLAFAVALGANRRVRKPFLRPDVLAARL